MRRLFFVPILIVLAVFTVAPIAWNFTTSFQKYDLRMTPSYTGMDNWGVLSLPETIRAAKVTVAFTVINWFTAVGAALVMAGYIQNQITTQHAE